LADRKWKIATRIFEFSGLAKSATKIRNICCIGRTEFFFGLSIDGTL
jgi:hypothetical protein